MLELLINFLTNPTGVLYLRRYCDRGRNPAGLSGILIIMLCRMPLLVKMLVLDTGISMAYAGKMLKRSKT